MRLLLLELRERIAHFRNECGDDTVEEAAFGAQLVAVTAGTANDAAQDVTAAFVRRGHAVGDEEAAGADMVGDDLQ